MIENVGIIWENHYLPLVEKRTEIFENLKLLFRDQIHRISKIRLDGSLAPCVECKKNIIILTVEYGVSLSNPPVIFTQDIIQCSYCDRCGDFMFLVPIKQAVQLLSHTL